MDQEEIHQLQDVLADAAKTLGLPLTTDQLTALATDLAPQLSSVAEPESAATPEQGNSKHRGLPRTLQEKLEELRALATPPGAKRPLPFRQMAREITQAGTPITDTHIRNIFSGKQPSPKKNHLEALAAYFGVSAAFLLDDFETARIEPQLRLLESLKGTEGRIVAVLEEAVRSAELMELSLAAAGLSPASLNALTTMAHHLHRLEGSEADNAAGD